ncbi:B-block binding subunit of TFIIIC [Arabidopsis thaliana]|uniref:B-block binding subunit of TFIIIC n=1 Tax=Arabidopsis thaliana TaxID=3702 RepID=F4I7K0_ARATH|nr:B-block binding subunit of TFIIIC [Arabidopsis thaliana]AEE29589.1 B-block binding subunit of TFIIIC [Arabidopsis thaliana]|eukprot:NP_173188.5 B-block binding subunit of TFIIIC [Arabidopsis thaliana]
MDSIVCTALEEICCQGNTGIPLVSLWSRLSPPPLSPSVKAHVWRNLLAVPQLQFKAKNTVYEPSDASIQQLEEALRLDLRIFANEKLRGNFVGLYDAQSNNTTISAIQRRVLERLAVARANGVAQNLLAKEFGIEGRNFFYIVKHLESRGLVVKQPAIVRTKEVDGEGDSKTTSCISTNMIYLSRYAKPLGSQQRFEICKEDSLLEQEATPAGDSLQSESTKEDTLIKDFLPAMQAICDKLEETNEKVLVVSDIKQDLGYLGSHSRHRAWRSVCRRLTDSHVVEEFDAVVNNKVERCLRLLKRFSAKDFNYSGKKQLLKFGRSIQKTEQTLELPIDNQIYDMVDAEGSKGLAVMEAESHKKTRVFRVWTSGNAGSECSDRFPEKAENRSWENNVPINDFGTPHDTGGLTQTSIEHSIAISDADFATPARLTDSENNSGVLHFATPGRLTDSESNSGVPDCSPSDAKRRHVLTRRNLQESFHEICDKVVDTAMGSPDLALSEMNHLAPPKPAKPKVHQPQPITVENSRRERRILERLNEEKFVVRAELHKWLLSLEKDRSSKVDRKTIDRILNRLQEEGLCNCMNISVPNVTNCGRNRSSVVVFHPSVQSLTRDIVGEIHDRIRSFELGLRGQNLSKRKSNELIPILNDIQRGQTNVDLDARASKSGAMRANGFVLAKMKSDNLFALEDAFKAMPLELFLQVVGSTQKADDMMKKCKQVMRLSELPGEEYKLLMDTLATGRLSMLIDILRRLKMVSSRLRRDEIEEKYANLTHAMELKPYIEEPVFVAATSNVMSLDFRPRIRHDFILSNRDAVDEYWLTLEYCYAAADHRAAKLAFPGSVVQERAKLLKRIAIDEKEKLSFKECEKIAKDLNLTLEQLDFGFKAFSYLVMHVYHAKHGRRVKSKSKDKHLAIDNSSSSSSGKRKRGTLVKTTGEGVRSIIVDGEKVLNSDAIDASNSEKFLNSLEEHQEHNLQENSEIRDLTEDEGQCSSIINQYASSKTTSTPSQRFSWTDEADRKLLSQYVRHRAALGAKFHGVMWASVPELPAPPLACKRRVQILMKNDKFRKAIMSLCNLLSERYARHLETKQKCLPESNKSHVLVRYLSPAIGGTDSGSVEQGKDICFDEEKWDDFNEKSISQAFNDVLELKKMAKLVAPKRTKSSREWSNRDIIDEGSEMVPPAIHSEDIQNVSVDQVKDTSRRSGHYRLHQTVRPLDEKDNDSIQVRKSLAVSTAAELLKLVFLSMPTAPGMPNLLEDTLRRYSERDLFTAYSYLRDKKFLVGGSGGQPFVLSQNFLHSISKSPFPVNTGTRAAKFSSWLFEHERDLMAGGVTLTSDLQCGDILNFFSLVSSGELSISVSLPEEGVGEPGDRRGLKRRADDIEESEAESSKKLKLLGEGEINFRKEKGFPGIAVSVRRATIPTANAIELFKDDDSRTGEFHLKWGEANSGCDSDDMKELFNSTDSTVIPSSLGDSPWQAMASFTSSIMSESTDEEVSLFSPRVFETVSNALQKAGDQGLSIEEVHSLIDIPSQETCDCIVDVLQTFGVALKVNGYNNFRVVHSFYRSKYFLTLEEDGTSQKSQQSLPVNYLERAVGEHRSKDIIASSYSTSQDMREHVAGNSVHKVTILNLPETAQTSGLHEASIKAPSVTFGTGIEGETKESTSEKSPVPIYPWVNADGSINKIVFDGLVRRVLGTVMQNPGIPEDEIINLMDILNPQKASGVDDTRRLYESEGNGANQIHRSSVSVSRSRLNRS